MKLLQFHSGTSYGDAITNLMLSFDKIFKKNNFDSKIYAEFIDSRLSNKIHSVDKISCSKNDILFIHHSMGTNCFKKIISLPCKKILVYHNITPTVFFDDEVTKKYITTGINQAKEYAKYVDGAIAVSNYNRKDLISFGYKNVDVLPLHISLSRLSDVQINKRIISSKNNDVIFLFVGRIVPNKKQLDLIKLFSIYNRYFNDRSKLYLVGDLSMSSYVNELRQYCLKNDLTSKVIFTGKVSDSDLKSYYSIADIFVCLSQHEGFCVPLIEAMSANIPVVALKSSAIEEVLHDSGVLFLNKSYNYMAAMCSELIENTEFRNAVLLSQKKRLETLQSISTENSLKTIINNTIKKSRVPTIQIQGPFETSYSLAKVNRLLGESLSKYHKDYNVSFFATEGPGDYIPNKTDLSKYKFAKKLYENSKLIKYPDITIRNMYPPRVWDVNGGLNFQNFAWEESYIPKNYIENFNTYLSAIGTTSNFVTKALINNGLKIPVKTIGNGVSLCDDYDDLQPYKFKTKKKIKFLHISSAFPRKGVDILIEGYYKAFTTKDDVCLILKTFPNIHNEVDKVLLSLNKRYPNHPEIEWINENLSDKELCKLYKGSSCYLHMARGEGFGLPVAEAMLAKIPTIVCNNSGLADFATDNTCITVKYNISQAKTHISDGNSIWYEPDINDYVEKIKIFVKNPSILNIPSKINAAYELVSKEYSWEAISNKWINFINEIYEISKKQSVAMVSTWNTKCGIAEYSKFLVESCKSYVDYHIFPNKSNKLIKEDESFVEKRLWVDRNDSDINDLTKRLLLDSSDIVHFQFNWGFYSIKNLKAAISQLKNHKKIVITFHSTLPSKGDSLKDIVKSLNCCSALLVHQKNDFKRLISYGVKKQILFLIPHGQLSYPYTPSFICKKQENLENKIVFGSYGFLLPHKGIYDVLQSVKELKQKYPNILYLPICSIYDCDESKDYYKKCLDFIEDNNLEKNVRFITEFLSNDDSIKYLRLCDFLIAPYHQTSESASGAIRFLFAAKRPIITSSASIFDEFNDYVYKFKCENQSELTTTIEQFIVNKKLVKEFEHKSLSFATSCSWNKTAIDMYNLYRNLK